MGTAGLIADALAALERGELIVFPTETVYGIGCTADAVDRLRRAKGRTADKPFQTLVASVEEARRLAVVPAAAEALMPGPVTLVLRAIGGGTIGIRVPDHPVARALLEASGPIVASSANRGGDPTPDTIDGVRGVFGDEVAVYVDAPPRPTGASSTVVDLTGAEPVVLREGAVPAARIEAVLRPEGGW